MNGQFKERTFQPRATAGSARCWGAWLLASALLAPVAAVAQHTHDDPAQLSFFVSAEGVRRGGLETDVHARGEAEIVADVIFGWRHDNWRAVSELVVGSGEQEFERLQFGYELVPDTLVWVGRYHQPASVWNLAYHHGQYLQTSITRPAIEEWEDGNGIVPQHVVGVLVESQRRAGPDGGWLLSVGAGVAPSLSEKSLEPYDLWRGGGQPRKHHVAARIEWLPDYVGESAIGLLASDARLTPDGPLAMAPAFTQRNLGAFVNWHDERWHLISAAYRVAISAERGPLVDEKPFWAAYVQASWIINPRLTVYARQEQTTRAGDSRYLALFEDVHAHSTLAGLRAEIARRHALTFEAASRATAADRYSEFRLQWSAALP
jgi:hypothetical protein